MNIALIVASTKEGYIGNDNTLSWFLPSDLKRFKMITTGHQVLMGRKTFDSIGKPLPNRKNVVISTTLDQKEGIEVFKSPEEWVEKHKSLEEKIFILGGTSIFDFFLPFANEIFLSELTKSKRQTALNLKFDTKINFNADLLIKQGWQEFLSYKVYDEKSFFKEDLKKEPISYIFHHLKR